MSDEVLMVQINSTGGVLNQNELESVSEYLEEEFGDDYTVGVISGLELRTIGTDEARELLDYLSRTLKEADSE